MDGDTLYNMDGVTMALNIFCKDYLIEFYFMTVEYEHQISCIVSHLNDILIILQNDS